jgi:hypothetical protein
VAASEQKEQDVTALSRYQGQDDKLTRDLTLVLERWELRVCGGCTRHRSFHTHAHTHTHTHTHTQNKEQTKIIRQQQTNEQEDGRSECSDSNAVQRHPHGSASRALSGPGWGPGVPGLPGWGFAGDLSICVRFCGGKCSIARVPQMRCRPGRASKGTPWPRVGLYGRHMDREWCWRFGIHRVLGLRAAAWAGSRSGGTALGLSLSRRCHLGFCGVDTCLGRDALAVWCCFCLLIMDQPLIIIMVETLGLGRVAQQFGSATDYGLALSTLFYKALF